VTDKETVADRIHEHGANDSHHVSPVPNSRRWVPAILHRWPTWLAIAMTALTVVIVVSSTGDYMFTLEHHLESGQPVGH
jgi:hypothetical protein